MDINKLKLNWDVVEPDYCFASFYDICSIEIKLVDSQWVVYHKLNDSNKQLSVTIFSGKLFLFSIMTHAEKKLFEMIRDGLNILMER